MSSWTRGWLFDHCVFFVLFVLASLRVNEQMLHDQYAVAVTQHHRKAPSTLQSAVTISTQKNKVGGYLGYENGKVGFVGSKDFWWGESELDDIDGKHTIAVYGGHLLPLLNKVAYRINYADTNHKITVDAVTPTT